MGQPGARPYCAAARAAGLLCAVALLAGCAARPGPPPVEEASDDESTTSATPPATPVDTRTRVTIGIDPLREGVNPHLIADSSEAVDEIAGLVLPSAFVAGEPNPDLLEEAGPVDPAPGAAQTVRYVIKQAAQWSDGTPVSGSDFNYLWRELSNTPGVKNRGAYQGISQIRVSGAGKVVEVDFAAPNAQWKELFSNLLPAHLLRGQDFARALDSGIPASAGRFLMHDLDHARGTVELQRNDRFWGPDPASIDIVTFRPIGGAIEASDQLRTGQVPFMDLTPAETTQESLDLVAGAQTMRVATGRRLELTMNVVSPVLPDAQSRAALVAQLDPGTVARLSAGRNTAVLAPEMPDVGEVAESALEELRRRAAPRPVRIGADPADAQASAAARVVVDQLRAAGVEAQVVAADLDEITRTRLPKGEVDAVIAWDEKIPGPAAAASRYGCAASDVGEPEESEGSGATPDREPVGAEPGGREPENRESGETTGASSGSSTPGPKTEATAAEATITEAARPTEGGAAEIITRTEEDPRGSNLSGYCTLGFQQRLDQAMAGEFSPEQLHQELANLEALEHLSVGLLDETRLWVLGEGIEGPDPRLSRWPEGIGTIASWKLTGGSGPTDAQALPAAPGGVQRGVDNGVGELAGRDPDSPRRN